ncbi:autonomous glycyl radical cofactor GrcA [Ferrimonas pelagia]|uniref:Autonomous glycyl radical cofactor GrcA n=1 Tax=Ferrimonas pelagia TaxID=1177826 RepID=A0ABP9EVD2_9GAMM
MINGIQITQSANANLLNSIWLIDEENQQARCLAAKAEFDADQVVELAQLGEYECRELNIQAAPAREGGQHLNVNVLKQETLVALMEAHERIAAGEASNDDYNRVSDNAQLTIRVSGYAVRFNALTLDQQKDVVMRTFTKSM